MQPEDTPQSYIIKLRDRHGTVYSHRIPPGEIEMHQQRHSSAYPLGASRFRFVYVDEVHIRIVPARGTVHPCDAISDAPVLNVSRAERPPPGALADPNHPIDVIDRGDMAGRGLALAVSSAHHIRHALSCTSEKRAELRARPVKDSWLRGADLNGRPSGYER